MYILCVKKSIPIFCVYYTHVLCKSQDEDFPSFVIMTNIGLVNRVDLRLDASFFVHIAQIMAGPDGSRTERSEVEARRNSLEPQAEANSDSACPPLARRSSQPGHAIALPSAAIDLPSQYRSPCSPFDEKNLYPHKLQKMAHMTGRTGKMI